MLITRIRYWLAWRICRRYVREYLPVVDRMGLEWTLVLIDEDVELYGNPFVHALARAGVIEYAERAADLAPRTPSTGPFRCECSIFALPTTCPLFMRKYPHFLLQPPGGGHQAASRQRRVAVLPLRTTQQCTNVLFFSSFIETVLRSGFPYSKKRHPLGQRRVAVLGSKPVPVY